MKLMAEQFPDGWKVQGGEMVFDCPYIKIRKEGIVGPDGGVHDWYVSSRGDFVLVFCLTADRKVVVNRQFKFGVKGWVVEPPAGYVDPGETPEAAARRELKEETGYEAELLESLGDFAVSPTSSTDRMYAFFAAGARLAQEPEHEACEVIERLLVSPEELRRMIDSREVNTVASLAVFEMGLRRLETTEPRI